MPFKVVNINDPGTATRRGADDTDYIAIYLNGGSLAWPVGPIDTQTIFKSNKLTLRDLSNTVNINIITSNETIPGSITIPPIHGNVTMLLDNDPRLYDSRNPSLHAITHTAGQTDELKLDDLGIPADNTNLNVDVNKHGLAPKLPADGLLYLDGTGNWTAPSGTGIINDNSLTGAKLMDGAVTAIKIAPGAITDSLIASGAAISKSKLANLAIVDADILTTLGWGKINKTGSKLQDLGDINITGLADGYGLKWDNASSKWIAVAPSSTSVPDNSVTTVKLVDGNVTLAKLASNSVDSGKIVDGSIMNVDINSAAAIAWAKISKANSSLTDFANVTVTSLTAGQVLQWNGLWWANVAMSGGGVSGSVSPVHPNRAWGYVGPLCDNITNGPIGSGFFSNSDVTNAYNAGVDGTGAYGSLTTTSTSNSYAKIESAVSNAPFRPSLNPKFYCRFQWPNAANVRQFIGITDRISMPTNTFNMLDGFNGVGLRYDTTTESTAKMIYNNAAASQNVQDLGFTPASGTIYDLYIELTSSSAIMQIAGTSYTKTSGMPASGTSMGYSAMLNTNTGSVRNCQIYYIYADQNN